MLTWMLQDRILPEFKGTYDTQRIVQVGSETWMLVDTSLYGVGSCVKVLVLDQYSKTWKEVKTINDSILTNTLVSISANYYNGFLYIWRFRRNARKLMKLNIETMEWSFIGSYNIIAPRSDAVAFLNNSMIFMEYGGQFIKAIDLTTGTITNLIELEKCESKLLHHQLFVRNEKVYLVLTTRKTRKVMEYDNGIWTESAEDGFEEGVYMVANIAWSSNNNIRQFKCNSENQLSLETFDFKTLTWNKQWIEHLNAPLQVLSVMENDYQIYVGLRSQNGYMLMIRTIDMAPRLSTICLRRIVDRVGIHKELDNIKEVLPMDIRHDLDSMTEWRLTKLDPESLNGQDQPND